MAVLPVLYLALAARDFLHSTDAPADSPAQVPLLVVPDNATAVLSYLLVMMMIS